MSDGVDILAVAAHPDDVELNIAGTLFHAADRGHSFAIVDLTQGERGTRGSADLRRRETQRANQILGIDERLRWNLGIPDGNIEVSKENTLRLVRAIRHFRPRIILFPWEKDRHPDHEHTHRLVRESYFDAGLANVETRHDGEPQEPHRPEQMYCFFHSWETTPQFVIDITEQFERKLDAIAAYASQFTIPGRSVEPEEDEPETFISSLSYMEALIGRMRHYGFMIGARYGEPYVTVNGGPIRLGSLFDTLA